jgi:Leucine-rich repeat (LRR) protein
MNCSNYTSSSPGLFVIKQLKSLIFIILIALSINSAVYGAIPASERAALIALYNSTNGNGWTDNSGWKAAPVDADGFAMPGTENTWKGVSVTDDHVEKISLPQNNLTGTIPPEVGNLANLDTLYLSFNELTGTIPLELCGLTNLRSLEISYNQLTGTVPPELEALTNLTTLYLSGNELSGPIPSEIGNLINLESLDLTFNELTGPIPSELEIGRAHV